MKAKAANNIKLGMFVLAGLLLLILGLYMIGRNSNFFGSNFKLRVRFENVQGLTAGNNVRYAGIEAGTVKSVKILSDTIIEVTLLIKEKMKPFIHQNDIASIGTDGLMGNKLINITPARNNGALVAENDLLQARQTPDTEEMLATLDKTNKNLALISEDIRLTVQRVNNSSALWDLLNEKKLPANLNAAVENIRNATAGADIMISDLRAIVSDTRNGKGSLGAVLTDTAIAFNLKEAIAKIRAVGDSANQLTSQLAEITKSVKEDINEGKGTVNALLKDSSWAAKLNNSLTHIEEGTAAFNQNMEALKHNFLLRGYFRKQKKNNSNNK